MNVILSQHALSFNNTNDLNQMIKVKTISKMPTCRKMSSPLVL